MSTLYNHFFDTVILPMLNPTVVARALQKKKPDFAAGILNRMRPEKALKVITNWSPGVRTIIVNEMGDNAVKLLSMMPEDDRARMLITLKQNIVKRYCRELQQDEVESLMGYWNENDLSTVVHRLSPKVAAAVVAMSDNTAQYNILYGLKPWVQQPLMEAMDIESKARIIDTMDFSTAIDLFSRWDALEQGQLIDLLSPKRQHEFFNVLSSKNIALILAKWDIERAREVLLNIDEERQRQTYMKLPEDLQYQLFPMLPEHQQILVLNICEPLDALKYLDTVSRDDSERLIRMLDDDQAASIRMATLMR